MFYAHFVLSKKGPLARIWLAAHWDKKLTKAHVFETNIDSSVEAIMQPKVKLALRTSGHLLLGVVRIYSRKAKYLLADCNEAFVKIKMAFRPGVVDLPEENREAAINAITLQENFHDFDTTLADLNDLDVQAQFSVNQSRPEDITMREDLASITFVDDGFGVMDGFGGETNEEEILCIIGCNCLSWDIIFSLSKVPHKLTTNCDKKLTTSCDINNCNKCICCLTMDYLNLNCKQTDLIETSSKPKPRMEKLDSGIGMDSDDMGLHSDLSDYESDIDEGCVACDSDSNVENDPKDQSQFREPLLQQGDVGFDDREILRDATNIEESLYKQPDLSVSNHQPIEEKEKTLNENVTADKPMDVDLEAPVEAEDEFGGPVDGGFMDADDDDDDNDNDGGFGGGVDQEFFGDDFMNSGGLFEEAPLGDVSMPPPVEAEEPIEDPTPESNSVQSQKEPEPVQPQASIVVPGASGEQTTLINNEEEAFALPPLDATIVPGVEKKGKRKRKLIVDEQKGIPSETMKLQLSDTSDIISTLDLAPPTKKLMHWKETGGVEKLFSLPGRSIASKSVSKLFSRNLLTKRIEEQEDEEERIVLEAPEITREEDKTHNKSRARVEEISTIVEEPSILEASVRSKKSELNVSKPRTPAPPTPAREPEPEKSHVEEPSIAQDIFASTFNEGVVDMPADPTALDPRIDPYEDPPSIAPFSVPPPSVPPPSVPPPSEPPAPEAPTFNIEGDFETEAMPETTEQEDQRWTKRTHQMQNTFDIAFRYKSPLSFTELSRNLNRKQAASRFYTLLVLKKFQAVEVHQPDEFGDIYIRKGTKFGIAC